MLATLCLVAAMSSAPSYSPHAVTSIAADDSVQPYPLTTCLASGESLADAEAPVIVVYENQEYRFISEEAAQPFRDSPALLAPRLAELLAEETQDHE